MGGHTMGHRGTLIPPKFFLERTHRIACILWIHILEPKEHFGIKARN